MENQGFPDILPKRDSVMLTVQLKLCAREDKENP